MLRLASTGLLLIGFASLGVAGFGYFNPEDGPAASIPEPDREFVEMATAQPLTVGFPIHNSGCHAVRVVGLQQC